MVGSSLAQEVQDTPLPDSAEKTVVITEEEEKADEESTSLLDSTTSCQATGTDAVAVLSKQQERLLLENQQRRAQKIARMEAKLTEMKHKYKTHVFDIVFDQLQSVKQQLAREL